ncbi:MAG: sarcosine oxidase subunit beta [Rhodospirillaceae bacterium TMED8]|nr:sarcosine oxidase subunit beta [Magnetovibrio sp.]OUT48993.1 MAG: sarcosine oxidase subunit beta [Rhodospirillaceae bacterium TMED8]|tara:strand:- start:731 stop:1987 length:1257 start_codon:yes stop_codon:yes gene_type:complete
MTRYSIFSLARNALSNHQNWPKVWRSPEPKSRYEIVIIGGGGHGLATAYYLAKNHGIKNVAVVEKGWLGGGNTGRNTTIVRSNYGQPGNTLFYEKSMQLWEGLSKDLNYNVMMSHRGVLNLAHNDAQIDAFQRRGNTMRINNIDAEWLSLNQVQVLVPLLNCSSRTRFPVKGGLLQPRAGTARHDAVAWGFARGADKYGIDIIQNCEVTGIDVHAGEVKGVQTTRGPIRATKVATAVAGHTAHLCEMVGMRMPLETHVLQAMVSEPIKPCLNTVVTSGAAHVYISQSDKGELVFGGDLDFYPSYAQRGNFPRIEDVAQNVVSLFPAFGRLRLMRTWGGIMDMSMDGSPIISTSHIKGFFINGGWCYGGFKATPGSGWVYAHTIANDAPHELNIKFALNRFESGALIDESGNGATAKAH